MKTQQKDPPKFKKGSFEAFQITQLKNNVFGLDPKHLERDFEIYRKPYAFLQFKRFLSSSLDTGPNVSFLNRMIQEASTIFK